MTGNSHAAPQHLRAAAPKRMIAARTRATLGLCLVTAVCSAALLVAGGCSLLPGRVTGSGGSGNGVATSTLPPNTGPAPSAPPTMPLAGKVMPAPRGAYLGVYVPPGPFHIEALDAFEKAAGRNAAIVMWYQPWSANNRSKFDTAACVEVMRRGAVPMITWEPWDPGGNANNVVNPGVQPKFALARINAGAYDTYLRGWAASIRDLGGPVMLRPMHEMNGNWYPWSGFTNGNSPAQYVAAWRRLHRIFAEEGATNVTWVWSINHESVPSGTANRYAAYYPGDAYVDWTAISGFNWGTSAPGTRWHTYEHWYAPPLAYLATVKKPICIAEFASVEQGGDKAAWIRDAYKRIAANKKIRAVVYFDSLEVSPTFRQDWRVNTSPQSLSAFKSATAPSYFVSRPPAALTSWVASLTPEQWQYLDTIQPVY